jgi:Na+-translocating ferredoxin:NAD+ oxidoreductase RnfD subunit
MMKYVRTPKVQMIGVLLFLFAVTGSLISYPAAFILFLQCVGYCVLLDVLFTYLRRRQLFKPFAAIVTGLILTLIIDPSATWYHILTICAAAMAIKNFARFGNRHIFNPAASGLFVGWLAFQLNPSWWAATLFRGENALIFNIAIYVGLLLAAYVSLYKLRRMYSIFSYLFTYALLTILLGSPTQSVIQTLVSPGVLFYALVMLPEPMTSPVSRNRQLLYGVVVSALTVGGVYLGGTLQIASVPDFSIAALLIGNLIFFRFR